MSGRSSGTLRLTNLALLTTVALIIFVIEANLPPLTSIPGIKMGLANIVTLSVFYLFSQKDALMVLLVRVILGALASGQIMTLPYSLSGGLLCFCVCAIFIVGKTAAIDKPSNVALNFMFINDFCIFTSSQQKEFLYLSPE